jgi:hypothetical protein
LSFFFLPPESSVAFWANSRSKTKNHCLSSGCSVTKPPMLLQHMTPAFCHLPFCHKPSVHNKVKCEDFSAFLSNFPQKKLSWRNIYHIFNNFFYYPTAINLVILKGSYVHLTICQPPKKEPTPGSFRWRELNVTCHNIFAHVQPVFEVRWLAFVSLVGVSRSGGVGGHPPENGNWNPRKYWVAFETFGILFGWGKYK